MSSDRYPKEDDTHSYCGSISGETFSSTRRRNRNTCSLRQHKHDALARKLREHPFETEKPHQEENREPIKGGSRWNSCFHHFRFLVVIMGGTSLGIMLLLRYNITVAILKMVNQTALYMEEHPNKTIDDFIAEGYTPGGEFNWDNEIQHMIMSWYMIAYTLPQVLTTKLGLMMGVRWATPISLFICGVATIMTPAAAYMGWKWVIVLRLVNGIGASAVLPTMLNLIEHWCLPHEVTLGLTLAQIQAALMTAFNPLVTGYLSAIHWSYAFYVCGSATIVFCVIWLLLVTDDPDNNWIISEKELHYLCSCADATYKDNEETDQNNKVQVKRQGITEVQPGAKWTDVFRVPSFWAYLTLWSCHCSAYSNFGFILPTYLRQFLKIRVSENGTYCFFIQLGCLIANFWPHPFLKFFEKRTSKTVASKIVFAMICLGSASTWIVVAMFHKYQFLLLFLNRCFHVGVDIVATGAIMSNYSRAGLSSIVFSMINTVGCMSVVFSSTTLGYMLDRTAQSVAGWTGVFLALGCSQLLMMTIFVLFTNTEPVELKGQRELRLANEAKQNDIPRSFQGVITSEQKQSDSAQVG